MELATLQGRNACVGSFNRICMQRGSSKKDSLASTNGSMWVHMCTYGYIGVHWGPYESICAYVAHMGPYGRMRANIGPWGHGSIRAHIGPLRHVGLKRPIWAHMAHGPNAHIGQMGPYGPIGAHSGLQGQRKKRRATWACVYYAYNMYTHVCNIHVICISYTCMRSSHLYFGASGP
jgi:hypothetical protein